MEQSGSFMRRKQFRVQIRRKEVQQILKKRRYQMIVSDFISGQSNMDDEQQVQLLLQLIKQYPYENLKSFVIFLVQLDTSLQLFLQLTNYTIKQLPKKFKNIIQNTLNMKVDNLIINQNSQNYTTSKINTCQIQLTQWFYSLSNWWCSSNAKSYYNILIIIKQINNYANLIDQTIIQFLSFVTNILLVSQRIAKKLDLQTKTVIGDHPMQIELDMSKCVLLNILGVEKDEQLCNILPQFLNYNGHSMQIIELYHNLFLIKNVQSSLRLHMVANFINLLQNNPQQMLQNHNQYILILYSCVKTNNISINNFQCQQYDQLCIRMIDVIGKLLKPINFKLNDLGQGQQSALNNKFKINLSGILRQLSDNKRTQQILLKIMYYESITQFMCNHLKYSQFSDHQTITSNIFNIFIIIANGNHSKDFFQHQQPRVFARLLTFLNKYLSIELYEINEEQYNKILKKLILLIYNMCAIDSLAGKFIEQNIISKVGKIYFKLKKQSSAAKYIKLYIQQMHINLFIHIQKHPQQYIHTNLIFILFDQLESCSIMLEMLKYSQKKTKVIKLCLIFWIFVLNSASEMMNGHSICKLMRDSSIISRLKQLQCCQDIQIQNYSDFILKQLEQSEQNNKLSEQEMVYSTQHSKSFKNYDNREYI